VLREVTLGDDAVVPAGAQLCGVRIECGETA
jgi:hypothetical protein